MRWILNSRNSISNVEGWNLKFRHARNRPSRFWLDLRKGKFMSGSNERNQKPETGTVDFEHSSMQDCREFWILDKLTITRPRRQQRREIWTHNTHVDSWVFARARCTGQLRGELACRASVSGGGGKLTGLVRWDPWSGQHGIMDPTFSSLVASWMNYWRSENVNFGNLEIHPISFALNRGGVRSQWIVDNPRCDFWSEFWDFW